MLLFIEQVQWKQTIIWIKLKQTWILFYHHVEQPLSNLFKITIMKSDPEFFLTCSVHFLLFCWWSWILGGGEGLLAALLVLLFFCDCSNRISSHSGLFGSYLAGPIGLFILHFFSFFWTLDAVWSVRTFSMACFSVGRVAFLKPIQALKRGSEKETFLDSKHWLNCIMGSENIST